MSKAVSPKMSCAMFCWCATTAVTCQSICGVTRTTNPAARTSKTTNPIHQSWISRQSSARIFCSMRSAAISGCRSATKVSTKQTPTKPLFPRKSSYATDSIPSPRFLVTVTSVISTCLPTRRVWGAFVWLDRRGHMLWVGHCYRYRQRSRKPKAHCDEKSLQRNLQNASDEEEVPSLSDTVREIAVAADGENLSAPRGSEMCFVDRKWQTSNASETRQADTRTATWVRMTVTVLEKRRRRLPQIAVSPHNSSPPAAPAAQCSAPARHACAPSGSCGFGKHNAR